MASSRRDYRTEVDFLRLDRIIRDFPRKHRIVLDRVAATVTASAKRRTPPRVDTGAMMNGWQWETTRPDERAVFNPLEHSIYNEFGTSRMSAHPMLVPALEDGRQELLSLHGFFFTP